MARQKRKPRGDGTPWASPVKTTRADGTSSTEAPRDSARADSPGGSLESPAKARRHYRYARNAKNAQAP